MYCRQLDWKRGIRGIILPVDDGWRISAAVAETSPERARKVSAELNRVLRSNP
jgi:hypothetical protein